MSVPTTITDLSVTAASNVPAGTDTVTTTTGPDEYFRALSAILRMPQAKGADVASATASGLGSNTDGDYFHVTGTTGIAASNFGTVSAGIEKTIVFDGALTLTHNSTSFILPGGANITTAAGDVAVFRSEGSGNWKCTHYIKASGAPIGSYQPLDALLTSLAGQTTAANKVQAYSGADTATLLTTGTSSGNIPLVGTSSATEALAGLVELATTAEASAGTDTSRAVTAAGITAALTARTASFGSVWVGTSNGYGSTNTAIRRFSTTHMSQGADITYTDSATNGASFTINTDGMYSISYTDSFTGAGDLGVSLNSAQLTTGVASITDADRLTMCTTAAGSYRDNCSVTVPLSAGDIIRPHAGASGGGTSPTNAHFTITRVA